MRRPTEETQRWPRTLKEVVALLVDPPVRAVVLSTTRKAKSRHSIAPIRAGCDEEGARRHHDTRLRAQWHHYPVAALNVLEGKVIGRCMPRHRHKGFIHFINTVEREVPADKAVCCSTTTPPTSTPS